MILIRIVIVFGFVAYLYSGLFTHSPAQPPQSFVVDTTVTPASPSLFEPYTPIGSGCLTVP
jgi:hypothetical protein